MSVVIDIPGVGPTEFPDEASAAAYFKGGTQSSSVSNMIADNPVLAALNMIGRGTMAAGKPAAAFVGANLDAAKAGLAGKPFDIRDFAKSFERVSDVSDMVSDNMEKRSPWASGVGKAIPAIAQAGTVSKSASELPSFIRGAIANLAFGQGESGGDMKRIPFDAILGGALEPLAVVGEKASGALSRGIDALNPVPKAKNALEAIAQLMGVGSSANKTEAGMALKDVLFKQPEQVGAAHGELLDQFFGGNIGQETMTKAPRALISRIRRDLKATGFMDDAGDVTGNIDEMGLRGGPRLSKQAQDEAYDILNKLGGTNKAAPGVHEFPYPWSNPTRKGLLNLRQSLQAGGKFGKDAATGSEAAYFRTLQREANADLDAEAERAFGPDIRKTLQRSRKGASMTFKDADVVLDSLGLSNRSAGDVDESAIIDRYLATIKKQPSVAAQTRTLMQPDIAESMKGQIIDDLLNNKAVLNKATGSYNIKPMLDRIEQVRPAASSFLNDSEMELLNKLTNEASMLGRAGAKSIEASPDVLGSLADTMANNVKSPITGAVDWLLKSAGRPIAQKGLQALRWPVAASVPSLRLAPQLISAAAQ